MMAIAYLKVRTSQRSKNLYLRIERAKHKVDLVERAISLSEKLL